VYSLYVIKQNAKQTQARLFNRQSFIRVVVLFTKGRATHIVRSSHMGAQ